MFTSSLARRAGVVAGTVAVLGLGAVAPAQAAVTQVTTTPTVGFSAGSLQPAGDVPPSFGAPLTNQLCGVAGDGVTTTDNFLECHQYFSNGAIFWNELIGAHQVHGAIFQAWVNENSVPARGAIAVKGLQPVTNEIPVANGVQQSFSLSGEGRVNYFWSVETGAHYVDLDTAAGQYFMNNGGVVAFGFPTSEVVVNTDGTTFLQTTSGIVKADFGTDGVATGSYIAY
ncbi:MAG: hypothetical protein Q3974_00025 [Rothia sp. (in: high G+C Gram-positive bacteria)]|nr:hypothetical protein [Rothia sp. (in: high G+C Gram-positive bacteria)]